MGILLKGGRRIDLAVRDRYDCLSLEIQVILNIDKYFFVLNNQYLPKESRTKESLIYFALCMPLSLCCVPLSSCKLVRVYRQRHAHTYG